MAVKNLANYSCAEAFADKLATSKILIEKVIKQSDFEKTQVIYLALDNGSREGPYIRKIISTEAGLGNVYKLLFDAQNNFLAASTNGDLCDQNKRPQQQKSLFIEGLTDDIHNAIRGIPWIFFYEEHNDEIEIIEEFIKGIDLATFCESGCQEGESIEIALSVCRAVSYLHEGFKPPIIHRDIKPENIIVRDKPSGNLSQQVKETLCSLPAGWRSSQQNKFKTAETSPVSRQGTNLACDKLPEGLSHSAYLIDFGIARAYDNTAEKDTRAFGTKGYAPPEQFGFAQTDERSDIYSLGKVLEFLFANTIDECGAQQNNGEKSQADSAENQTAKLSSLSALSQKITRTACAFDPDNRFSSVEEIIAILEEYKNTMNANENTYCTQSTNNNIQGANYKGESHSKNLDVKDGITTCFDSENEKTKVVQIDDTLKNPIKTRLSEKYTDNKKSSIWWITYDLILSFVFVLLSICSCSYFFGDYTNTIVSSASNAASLEPIIGFIVVEILIFLPAFILLFYKKPIYKRWPQLPRFSRRSRIILVLVCSGLIMILMFILKALS